jgi:hypothetical protein
MFINAKPSISAPLDGRVDRVKKEHCSGDPKTSRFYLGLCTWKTGSVYQLLETMLCVINSTHNLNSRTLSLGWSDLGSHGDSESVRLYYMSQFIYIASPFQYVIHYQHSSHNSQPSGLLFHSLTPIPIPCFK